MARSRLPSSAPRLGPPRRRWRRFVFWGLVALAALVAWFWQPLYGRAIAAASNGARVGCSCRFVARRDIGQCRSDLDGGMGLVTLSADEEAKSVTARFPLISSQTATWRKGEGCMLEKWGS